MRICAGPAIVVNPIGGLANRMCSMGAAVHLARVCGVPVRVVWSVNAELGARFHTLFRQPERVEIVHPSALASVLKYDMPRRRNLFIPALWQHAHFGLRLIDGPRLMPLLEQPERVEAMAREAIQRGRNVYAISGFEFFDFPDSLPPTLFVPIDTLQRRIAANADRLGPHGVGVHIRRTDNRWSIEGSPTEKFIEMMDRRLDQVPDTVFYLATDSDNEKRRLIDRYGRGRIVTNTRTASRIDTAGMEDAVVEMWTLSRTNEIYGSAASTYSAMAARLGAIPLHR